MKKILFLTLILFFICCSKSKKNNSSNINFADSVKYYSDKIYIESQIERKKSLNKKLLSIIRIHKNSTQKRKIIDEIINNCYNFNDWNTYKVSSDILLNESELSRDSVYLSKALRYQGNYYYKNKILDSSFYYYTKSEKIFYKLNDLESYAVVLLKKGIVQLEINDFVGADASLTKAYYIFITSKDKQRLYATLNSLGTVSTELKDYQRAEKNYEEAIRLVKKENIENDEYRVAVSLNNLGLIFIEQSNYVKAISYFEKGLNEKDIKIKNPELYSIILENLAFSKFKSNNFTNLPNLFFEALKIKDSLNDKISKITVYNHLSEYYFSKNDSLKAKEFSNKALKSSYNIKMPGYLIASLKQATKVDKKNASKYSEEYIRISDSLQLEERKNKDRFARIELETDELRQENTQLSEQNRDILNYFMIAIVFGGFLFFARFQRLKARELALKQTQQQANEEIYRLIISHQNQLEEGRDLEKKRISKELHDGVLGRLFGLRLNLDGLNNFDDDETKQQRLDYLNELKIIEQDLREISHELSRENLVLINNFVAIINNLLEQQTKINTAKINTLISDKIDWEKVSNTIKINLYRILQESLQNINKHAEAKTINIIFNKDSKGNLIFSIEDDGKGYNTNGKKTKGIGVNNIVDRVHQCQGKIDIKSQIGKGTKIIITFPLENETINM